MVAFIIFIILGAFIGVVVSKGIIWLLRLCLQLLAALCAGLFLMCRAVFYKLPVAVARHFKK